MKIGVVHPDLELYGGAEYVTLEILQCLASDHDVELITFNSPDVEGLNSFYDTSLDEDDFSVRVPWKGFLFRFTDLGFKVRNHLIKSFAKKNRGDYDLLVSGMDEADFGEPGFQYVHFPESVNEQVFHETGKVTTDLTATSSGLVYSFYLELVDRFFKESKEGVELNKTVCNSSFTKSVYEQVFDNKSDVVNPPVSMKWDKLTGWSDRKEGILCIGKVNPTKGQKEVIEIIDELNQRGHDVHLHIIGSLDDSEYCKEVQRLGRGKDFVHVEGRLERSELKEMISNHKYGIHNFEGEHYGLAPAEMSKGGCITFVPGKGGPKNIVGDREELVFNDKDEAVKKIEKVLSDEELQRKLFAYIQTLDFNSPKDFRVKIKELIESCEVE